MFTSEFNYTKLMASQEFALLMVTSQDAFGQPDLNSIPEETTSV